MKIERFEDLQIWQDSRELTKLVWNYTKRDSFNKDFRFRDQIRASAGSTMDNISEGFGRGGNKEFINFLLIAKGSNEETRSQLYRAFDFEYISKDELTTTLDCTDKISRKIANLITYLKDSSYKGTKRNLSKEPNSLYLPDSELL